jgi:hypothetical protein
MEPQVIEIVPEIVTSPRKPRIVSVALQAVFWILGMVAFKHVTFRFGANRISFTELILPLILGGVCYGLVLYFIPWQRLRSAKIGTPTGARLIIEVDRISLSVRSPDDSSWRLREGGRKGMVRSIFRIPGGIGVSERGQFEARMLGFLALPYALPEFNKVKALVNSWRVGVEKDSTSA